ncbi:hypothetical protein JG687_00015357 [Phytophthora cactorum]|uniref:Uncharacterized protein n=1 Tax=Phytophthora cactorum TaxID=29920 RepID=A0A8T1TUU0_9STRA|nr:hypothetical protein GQ600_8773 [Phytophthora cactorum]KAG6948640.1 hypothetical protein JG687_00015357 [Phytophthora cactorum]
MYESLEKGMIPLRQVIDKANARPSSPIGNHPVEYVRLRREEQTNMVVLSHADKYERVQALFEPVIENLSGGVLRAKEQGEERTYR